MNHQYNKHGYYVSLSYECGCCGTDTKATVDEVMVEFDRVGRGVHTLELAGYSYRGVDTSLMFSIHCAPRLGAECSIELPMSVEQWISDWRKQWHKKNAGKGRQ